MGKREKRQRGPADVAAEKNLWIKVNRAWFTPGEFEKRFRDVRELDGKAKIEILNPLIALQSGRAVIERMILEKKPASTVLNALDRLNRFADKIIREQYRPKPTQVDSAEWPEVSNELRKKAIEWGMAQQEARHQARLEAARDKRTYVPDNDFLISSQKNNPDF